MDSSRHGPSSVPDSRNDDRLGGHVRVGFEDNVYLERGVLPRATENS